MHLGASYMDDSKEAERRVVAFLDSIKSDASEIYLLGDVLDYWFEYRYVVPRGYVRFFGKLAELTDAGIKVTWIIGNHDIWIFDYIPSELGVEVVDGVLNREVLGARMVMAHGDGVWQQTRKFKMLRSLFRNRVCQRLFAGIHPRWTVPFAYAWSHHSRENGGTDYRRDVREGAHQAQIERNVAGLKSFCQDYLTKQPDVRFFLFGHLHVLLRERLTDKAEMIVLGEWLTLFSYAVFDGERMELRYYNSTKQM